LAALKREEHSEAAAVVKAELLQSDFLCAVSERVSPPPLHGSSSGARAQKNARVATEKKVFWFLCVCGPVCLSGEGLSVAALRVCCGLWLSP